MSPKAIVSLVGGVVIIALLLILNPFTVIDPGEGAVVTRLGAISRTLTPGTHLKQPLFEHVIKYDVQVQKDETEATAASSDLQTVNAVIAVNYQIDSSSLADTYTRIGREDVIKPKVIDPAVQEVVKASTAKYKADELITKRAEVTDAIKVALAERLRPYNILVQNVSVVNFDFSDSFNQAIEKKVTAEQDALAAKNKLEQVKYESEQTIVAAQGVAEAQRIKAAALQSQGGRALVDLTIAEKWNGVLPTTMVPGSSIPFINVK